MQELFGQIGKIKCPVLGLYGDQDVCIPLGTVQQFQELLTRNGVEHEIKVYPNSGHAFFRDTDPTVCKRDAARDAWELVARFFAKHMKTGPHTK